MTNKFGIFAFIIILTFSCNSQNTENIKSSSDTLKEKEIVKTVKILPQEEAKYSDIKSIPLPEGYKRIKVDSGSFGFWLRNVKLKTENNKLHLYDGSLKYSQNLHYAILKFDVGKRDLQQCADAVMRLRAEYLYKMKKYNQIHFNFTNGFRVDYDKWRQGNRIAVNGNNTSWVHKTEPDNSYQSFREYLNWIFMYAGSLSLSRELKPVNYKDMQIGDVLIHGGSPGHAVIVIDMAINSKTKEKVYLLAQSYMPAQDIHVLINPDFPGISPWYKLDPNESIVYTPEWEFYTYELMRF